MRRSEDPEGLAPLVIAAREGDPLAFEALMRRFRKPLASYACALLRDRGLAEDAAQEACLRAYRRLRALRDPNHFRAWIYTILEHVALSGWRRRRRLRTVPLLEGDAVAEGPGPATAEDGTRAGLRGDAHLDRPELRAVREVLDGLPGIYSEALHLHYVEGLTVVEVARALGLSVNTAKVRLHRARNAFRRDYTARGADAPARRASR